MKSLRAGQLATVSDADGSWDAIVSDTSHMPKLSVVAVDAEGTPTFREVHMSKVSLRREPGPHDQALRKLISAASAEARSGAPGSGGNVLQGRPAHTGPRMHRPTGR